MGAHYIWHSFTYGMQDKCGLPWVVGLDLTSTDTDMLTLAPALAVKRLDPPEDAEDPSDPQAAPPSFYLCLLSDNRSAVWPACYGLILVWQLMHQSSGRLPVAHG